MSNLTHARKRATSTNKVIQRHGVVRHRALRTMSHRLILALWCLMCLSPHNTCKLSHLCSRYSVSVVDVRTVQQLVSVCVTVKTHIKRGQYDQGSSSLSSTCGRCKSGALNSGAEGCEEEGKGVHLNMFNKTTQH